MEGSNRGYCCCKRIKTIYYKKGKAPKYVDEFNEKANKIKLAVWQIWEARDLSIKIIIKLNIKSTPNRC